MRRREFIALVGRGAAAWPLAARAQQPSMPVIGFLHLTSLEARERELLAAFHRGLNYTGYVEGKNVAFEYRWAQGHNDRLAPLVAELVRGRVSVIAMLESTNGALAAQAATQTIPVERQLLMPLRRPGLTWFGEAGASTVVVGWVELPGLAHRRPQRVVRGRSKARGES